MKYLVLIAVCTINSAIDDLFLGMTVYQNMWAASLSYIIGFWWALYSSNNTNKEEK